MDSQGTVLALSVLSHGSVFLTPIVALPIIIPLVLWLACKNSTIKANAKEAFNFQIYVFFIREMGLKPRPSRTASQHFSSSYASHTRM